MINLQEMKQVIEWLMMNVPKELDEQDIELVEKASKELYCCEAELLLMDPERPNRIHTNVTILMQLFGAYCYMKGATGYANFMETI